MANEKMIKEMQEEAYKKGFEDGISEGLTQGQNEVWEFMKKCFYAYTGEECEEIFGKVIVEHIVMTYTPQEALAKLKAYEDQSKIKVGNVVKSKVTDSFVLLVLEIHNDVFTGFDGKETHRCIVLDNFKKTGKHIDITSILEQIGEV